MRVCLIVEGSYPYVMGGVASWIQNNIQHFSDVEFIVQTIVVDRHEKKKFAYQIPANVVEIREAYLQDEDYGKIKKKFKLTKKEKNALKSLFWGNEVDWETLFVFFQKKKISMNSLLASEEFFEISRLYYEKHYPEEVFSDFLWTMRSMVLPLLSILNTRLPEADIYHVLSTGYAGILGSMAKFFYNKPLLLSEHGIYTREREEEIIRAEWVKGIYKDLWIHVFQKYSTCCYKYADVVTALFQNAAELQVECGCEKEKITIIRNGIDISEYQNLPTKEKDDQFINIGAILRITQIKDVKTLISAFAAAKRIDPRLKLWIMGPDGEDKEYVEECKELVRLYKVEDIIFTGRIDVKDYIGKMDFLILTSISEGQPLVILEGFAAKKPFICTNVGNCFGMLYGEADNLGKAGIIVPVMGIEEIKDAMIYLASHEDIRKKMGEIGYQRVKDYYKVDDVYAQYRFLYDNLKEEE